MIPSKLSSPNSKQPWMNTYIKHLSRGSNMPTIRLVLLMSLNNGPGIITLNGNVNESVVLLITNMCLI